MFYQNLGESTIYQFQSTKCWCEPQVSKIVGVPISLTSEKPQVSIVAQIDGWMNCDFTSFSTEFQFYQDDGMLIMKGCVQWNFTVEKISPRAGIELGPLNQYTSA